MTVAQKLGKQTDKSRVALLKAELEIPVVMKNSPRFWASPLKEMAS